MLKGQDYLKVDLRRWLNKRKQNQKSAAHPFLFLCLQMLKSEPLAFCGKRTGLPNGGPKEVA